MFKCHKTFAPHLTDTSLYPDQVAFACGVPAEVDVSGRTVGILELGGLVDLNDVAKYCASRKYKMPQITIKLVDSATEVDSDATGECALDIDVIAGVAQGIRVAIAFAPNTEAGFLDGFNALLALNVDAISISWGAPESQWTNDGMMNLNAAMKAAAEKGIGTFVASGDNGSTDGTMSDVTDFPACSPYAIACGGTRLELAADGTRGSETAWSSSLFDSSGSGGGISSVFPTTPDWQKNILTDLKAGRRSPDISSNADPATGYQVIIDGQLSQVGGTSASAPFFAAFFCILNAMKDQHIGNLHTKLYEASADCFVPITEGNNGHYKAEAPYSCVCGLGVPVADKLLAAL